MSLFLEKNYVKRQNHENGGKEDPPFPPHQREGLHRGKCYRNLTPNGHLVTV